LWGNWQTFRDIAGLICRNATMMSRFSENHKLVVKWLTQNSKFSGRFVMIFTSDS